MATWKKVIVSGSNAILNQLNVSTDQQIGTTQETTFLTGSFSGSFTGDGSALTGLSSANNTTITLTAGSGMSGGGDFTTNQSGTETITFTNAGVTSNVAGTGISVSGATGAVTIGNTGVTSNVAGTGISVSGGTGAVTIGNTGVTSNVAGGGISVSGGTGAVTIAVNSGSMLPFISSSIFSTISGDVLVDADGVAAIGSNVIVNADINSSAAIAYSKLASLTSGRILVGNSGGVATSTAVTGDVTISNTGVTAIGSGVIVNADIAASTINLTQKVTGILPVANGGTGINSLGTGVATFLGTPSSANLRSAVTDETGTGGLVFAASPTFTGTVRADNLTVAGDLTVNGTLTTLATTNVSIKDQFITIASGSQTDTDGGIIVSKQANGSGFAFGYDASLTKWVLQNNAAVGATTLAPDAFIGIVSASAAVPTANPVYGGATGYGNIHVKTDTGDIWIYA